MNNGNIKYVTVNNKSEILKNMENEENLENDKDINLLDYVIKPKCDNLKKVFLIISVVSVCLTITICFLGIQLHTNIGLTLAILMLTLIQIYTVILSINMPKPTMCSLF